MRRINRPTAAWFLLIATGTQAAPLEIQPPEDFPRFIVPGQELAMDSLRKLFFLHHQPPAGPLATLWDEWMTAPTLWPAMQTGGRAAGLRAAWASTLAGRIMEPDGYVATHQHPSIAHQHGWPFPFWAQGGEGCWGWHFSLANVPPGWHNTSERDQKGWEVIRGDDRGIVEAAWNLNLQPNAGVRTPPLLILPLQSPFIQLRWRADGLGGAQPYLEWVTEEAPEFSPQRRMYFDPITTAAGMVSTMIPVYCHPHWKGRITRLGIGFANPAAASIGIQALFSQYDTRHSINNANFIRGCINYFNYTGDMTFLRSQIQRMRLAMGYCLDELGGLEHKCISLPWVGHDGRSGLEFPNGQKVIRPGRGIGHHYWDIVPSGQKDAYSTNSYYDALLDLAGLEEQIARHPEWNLPAGALRREPEFLRQHAAEVKDTFNRLFWNDQTGRFVLGVDADGKSWDYGYTFMSLEAIHYGTASPEHAERIMQWITGERIVEGDTSQGADIYRWVFGPRSTTRRNVEWYGWYWSGPESIAFGDQVQDGGAVLGFSYHDLMGRLNARGADDAWKRLQTILGWFNEVLAEGGYREYYKDRKHGGTMQGSGTPGGLGLDMEFFESILVPQVVIDGFLGFAARADGFALNPRLPSDWPSLTITRIAYQGLAMDITAGQGGREISITVSGSSVLPLSVFPPPGEYQVSRARSATQPAGEPLRVIVTAQAGVPLDVPDGGQLRMREIASRR